MRPAPGQAGATPVSRVLWVLVALMVFLSIGAGSALLKLGVFNTAINMSISVMRTLLVMSVFMHETEARNLTLLMSAAGFVWLSMLMGLALFDYMTRTPVPAPW